MREPAVHCQQLTKAFGTTAVVQDVSFAIQPGHILALLDAGVDTPARLAAARRAARERGVTIPMLDR